MPHVGPWVFVDGRSDRTQGMHHHCLHGAPSTSRGRQWTEPRSDPFIRTILTHDGSAGTSGIRMVEDRQPLQVPPRVVPDRRPTWCQRVGNATSHRGHGICLVGITEHPMVRAIIYIRIRDASTSAKCPVRRCIVFRIPCPDASKGCSGREV